MGIKQVESANWANFPSSLDLHCWGTRDCTSFIGYSVFFSHLPISRDTLQRERSCWANRSALMEHLTVRDYSGPSSHLSRDTLPWERSCWTNRSALIRHLAVRDHAGPTGPLSWDTLQWGIMPGPADSLSWDTLKWEIMLGQQVYSHGTPFSERFCWANRSILMGHLAVRDFAKPTGPFSWDTFQWEIMLSQQVHSHLTPCSKRSCWTSRSTLMGYLEVRDHTAPVDALSWDTWQREIMIGLLGSALMGHLAVSGHVRPAGPVSPGTDPGYSSSSPVQNNIVKYCVLQVCCQIWNL